MRHFLFAIALFLIPAFARSQDGIYADFQTSLGNFTCQLHYDRAPRTVANFIALATGDRGWLDIPTGDAKRRPFYDGLTFHRVVSGFVIQGGSPNGNGTDGPGYTFKDEFHPTLRHTAAGVLSMANSGPQSNGSQFFVTLDQTSHLNDVHSVFGNVTSGLNVVQAIGTVAVNSNGKPLTPVVMQSVTIRRVGTAAQNFDIHLQGLPTVGGANPKLIAPSAGALALQFPRAICSEYWVYKSSNLVTWTPTRIGLYEKAPPAGDFDVSAEAGQSRYFFRVPEIAYPGPIYTPLTLRNSTVTMTFTGVNLNGAVVTYAYNGTGTGTWSVSGGGSGQIGADSTWNQEAYRGSMLAYADNFYPMLVTLIFNGVTSGTFSGNAYNWNGVTYVPYPVTGTFTRTEP
jgi:peptidyl-prolyl cis-trans isomerase A (cyclophilin A)